MTDIVKRLRQKQTTLYGGVPQKSPYGSRPFYTDADVQEAADELEQRRDNERILWADNRRLQAEIEELRMRLDTQKLVIRDGKAEIERLRCRLADTPEHNPFAA